MSFTDIGETRCRPDEVRVFEHGWQSWSPTGAYRLDDSPPRPADETIQILCYRPETPIPAGVFQGEGLLAVDPGDGSVELWSAPNPLQVPSIRARRVGPDRLVISANGPVRHHRAAP
jgi:alpha-galactosidase